MIFSEEERLPTHLWVEAEMRRLSAAGIGAFVTNKGDKTGGLVVQKIADMQGRCRLLLQQRDLAGRLVWMNALEANIVAESEADAYIARAVARDPDLWVIELEDRSLQSALAGPSVART